MRSPVYILPVDVLSYIFQLAVDPGTNSLLADIQTYSKCLRQSLILSSVSTHLRQVALGTPELWKRIPLKIFKITLIDRFTSLLGHCTALSPYVGVSVWEVLNEAEAPRVVETLLTPDIARKIRAFELKHFQDTANIWIKKLQVSSPMLNTFSITRESPAFKEADDETSLSFDLGSLDTVTRVVIRGPYLVPPINLPPSVQVLRLYNVPKVVQLSLIYQCPNLIECLANSDEDIYADIITPSPFPDPLALNYLKRLTWPINCGLDTIRFVQNFQLPSLEYLQIHHYQREKLDGVRLLCYNVSATLTTLVIYTLSFTPEYDDLRELFRLPLPMLVNLGISSISMEPILSAIRALPPNDGECNDLEHQHLPSLRLLILACNSRIEPHLLPDLFTKWRIGETSYFHVKVKSPLSADEDWSPELREELKSIVGDRRIEVTWNNKKIQQLYGENSLVQKTVGGDAGNL
jgi:hypothetical protein